MMQSRAKTPTLVRSPSRKEFSGQRGATEAVPYLVILGLLCALSILWAIKDPLAFSEIFGRM